MAMENEAMAYLTEAQWRDLRIAKQHGMSAKVVPTPAKYAAFMGRKCKGRRLSKKVVESLFGKGLLSCTVLRSEGGGIEVYEVSPKGKRYLSRREATNGK